jgi:mycoredoxin
MVDLYSLSPSEITFYGVAWCGDCRRARQVLSGQGIKYIDIDIDNDKNAAEFVRKINNGNRSVPTIIFPDGTTLTEPDNPTLVNHLKTHQTAA